jgi:hypothetical protein
LHGGRVPQWLAGRMTRFGAATSQAIAAASGGGVVELVFKRAPAGN